VVSAGIPMYDRVVKKLSKKGVEIIGELTLIQSVLKGINVAVTGTNGKTTVTFLINHILNSSGRSSRAIGNCGTSVAAAALEEFDYNIIEVSSYMMEKSSGFKAHISVLTNLSPEHIKHHKNLESYYNSKVGLFLNQDENDFSVINGSCNESSSRTQAAASQKFYFNADDELICPIEETQLIGGHNRQNILAATKVCQILGLTDDEIIEGLRKFTPPRHRLNRIKAGSKVFINDSKATNVNSTLCALKAVKEPKVLIAGGSGKNEDFKKLFTEGNQNVRTIICYGREGRRIYKQIRRHFLDDSIFYEQNFEAAVMLAAEKTGSTEVCLLSPACASFDQHKNFEHRGDEFEKIIRKLNG